MSCPFIFEVWWVDTTWLVLFTFILSIVIRYVNSFYKLPTNPLYSLSLLLRFDSFISTKYIRYFRINIVHHIIVCVLMLKCFRTKIILFYWFSIVSYFCRCTLFTLYVFYYYIMIFFSLYNIYIHDASPLNFSLIAKNLNLLLISILFKSFLPHSPNSKPSSNY